MKEIEESVVDDIRARRDLGRKKYGMTMERGDLSLKDWLQHAYEESLDHCIYLKRAIRDLTHIEPPEPMDPEVLELMLHPEC